MLLDCLAQANKNTISGNYVLYCFTPKIRFKQLCNFRQVLPSQGKRVLCMQHAPGHKTRNLDGRTIYSSVGPCFVGVLGRLIIWGIETNTLFRPRTLLAKVFEGACRNCGLFSEKFFRVRKPEFTSPIFPITPVTSQRSRVGRRTGQPPGWRAPYVSPVLLCNRMWTGLVFLKMTTSSWLLRILP